MIRTFIMILFLGLCFCLLHPLSVFSQDCGWVLWMKREIMNFEKNRVPEIDISWDVITAYPKHESCMDAKQKVWQRRLKQIQDEKEQNQRSVEIKSVPYDGISKTYKGKDGDSLILMSWSEQFLCLPSSLDPREKSSR